MHNPIKSLVKKSTIASLFIASICTTLNVTAAAGNACSTINTKKNEIVAGLFDSYGGENNEVALGRNNGGYRFMFLTGKGQITKISGCTIYYKAPAKKFLQNLTGNNVGTFERHGEAEWQIGFTPASDNSLCISFQKMRDVDWNNEGAVKENRFLRFNATKRYFNGCL